MKTITHALAGLPLFLKGKTLFRLGGKLVSLQNKDAKSSLVFTNLGIHSGYHIEVPLAKPLLAFGNPMAYVGERGVMYLSKHLVPSVDAVMDIGANWGYYTFFLRKYLDASMPIYFFEPNETLFKSVENNVRRNRMPNVHGQQLGLSSFTGTASFFVNLSNDLSSSLDGEYAHSDEILEKHTIRVTTFDDFAARHEPGKKWLVKVDIENAESEFVKGAAGRMGQVEYLIIEFLEKARREKLADVLIEKHDFFAYYINDFKLEYMPKEDGRYSAGEYNFLFCRLDPAQLTERMKGSRFEVVGDA